MLEPEFMQKHWVSGLVPLLAVLAVNSSATIVVKPQKLLDQFRLAHESLSPKYFARFLAQAEGVAPWLKVIGKVRASEDKASQAISKTLYGQYGYTTVMLSKYKGIDTPGFDGFLLDQAGDVVANFSLKELSTGKSVLPAVCQGVSKACKYSDPESWVSFHLCTFTNNAGDLNKTYFIDHKKGDSHYQKKSQSIYSLSQFMGIGSQRSTILGLYLKQDAEIRFPDQGTLDALAQVLSDSSVVSQIVILYPEVLVIATREAVIVKDAGCRSFLK